MELSRPVVVQHHGHLTLTLDFQGQILKMLHLRNGRVDWHGAKGMWIDGMLDPHFDFELWSHPWPWPLIFKVKFWKSHNSGMGCPIDLEQKGCEPIGCYTYFVTLSYDHDLGFSRSNFENVVSQEWEGRLTWNQSDVSRKDVKFTLWLWTLTSPITSNLDFQGQNFNSHILGMPGKSIHLEYKRCELDTMLDAQWTCSWATVHGK